MLCCAVLLCCAMLCCSAMLLLQHKHTAQAHTAQAQHKLTAHAHKQNKTQYELSTSIQHRVRCAAQLSRQLFTVTQRHCRGTAEALCGGVPSASWRLWCAGKSGGKWTVGSAHCSTAPLCHCDPEALCGVPLCGVPTGLPLRQCGGWSGTPIFLSLQ